MANLYLTCHLAFTADSQTLTSGDLEIDAASIEKTLQSLAALSIDLQAISGAWGNQLVKTVHENTPLQEGHSPTKNLRLILGSETIYSPSSLRDFTATLISLLRGGPVGCTSLALIAAKKIYFGVGGGIDDFVNVLSNQGGSSRVVWDSSDEGGVGRCILEVKLT